MLFGQKASDEILDSSVSETIKHELELSKGYAEGRGIRLDIKNKSLLKDITCLIQIKVAN